MQGKDLKKSKLPRFVIPGKAGIQLFQYFWTPAFAGVTVSGFFTDSSMME